MLLALAAAAATLQPPHHDAYGYAQRGWFDRLLYPIELNPEKRLPRVEGDLIDIAFSADGKTGFALGEGGAILMTENGGLDWREAPTTGVGRLKAAAVSGNGALVVAVGMNRIVTMRKSAPGWRQNIFRLAEADYDDVQVSDDGEIIRAISYTDSLMPNPIFVGSNDGGATWNVELELAAQPIRSMTFDGTGRNGWMSSASGQFFTTVDGGQTWSTVDGPVLSRAAPADAAFKSRTGPAAGPPLLFGASLLDPGSGAPYPEDEAPRDEQTARSARSTIEASATPDAAQSSAPSLPGATAASFTRSGARYTTGTIRGPAAVASSGAGRGSDGSSAPRPSSKNESSPKPTTVQSGPIVALAAIPGIAAVAGIREHDEGSELFVGDRRFRVDERLTAIAMADSETGWAVGEEGAIWGTTDGATWDAQFPLGFFTDVAAARDGQRAWAVGRRGVLLATFDGRRWFAQLRVPADRGSDGAYMRFPAPWFYLTLIGFGGFVAWARRPLPAKPREAFDGIGATDAPVILLADDKLQFAPLARGISRYLRNANTRPPLTLAISGDWGSGKSSLMRMVCEDLRRRGNHPVWFNAWHHQGEEQLLAALLTAIRDTALPPWLSLDGLRFRALLLLKRARRRLPATLVLVAIAGFGLAVIVRTDWSEIAAGLQTLFTGGKGTGLWESDILKSAPGIAALVTVLAGVLKALTAFGANPAVLLTSTIDNFKLRDASAQVHFRTRFQQQFREVAEALPYPLVIVIDDLDRCRPETVLQVMESVNFLMSSGECFVLFGMATHRVQAALAHSFKDIAGELVEIDDNTPATVSAEGRDRAEREKRLKYAGEYLQKLINLDIRVPRREDIAPHLLLTRDRPPEAYDRNEFAIARRWAGLLWPLLLAAGIAGGAWWAGSHVLSSATPPAGEPAKVAGAISSTPSAAVPTREVGATAAPIQAETGAARPVEVIEGAKGRGGIDWAVAILLGAVLAIVAILQYRKRKADALVFDTKPFTDALKVWTPIVARRYNSPRAIKRFGNRLRYFAMLQQAEEPVEEAPTDWRSRLRFRGESATASIAFKPDKARVDVVAEHRIVALGAIHEVFGDKYWRIWVTEGKEPSPKPFAEPADYGDVAKAVAAYKADGRRWPPSAEELDAFERSLKGIRLDGEVAVIAETEPAPEPPRSGTPKQTPPKLKARSNSTDRGSRFVELETPVGSKERG